MSKTAAIVGLGSNLSALKNLRRAVAELKKKYRLCQISSIYESEAQVLQQSPKEFNQSYLNAAVLIEIDHFVPTDFLADLKSIEKKIGRKTIERWAPREIDLDILYAEGCQIDSENLAIPHRSLAERPFALLPAIEVYPELRIDKPLWCQKWVQQKPFNTVKSKNYFWPEFVGVLNVTTDSFSDAEKFLTEETFKKQVLKLVSEGASVIDIGAESTRPKSSPVDSRTELDRLNRALTWFNELNLDIPISVDTKNPDVLSELLNRYRIDYINDVTGFENPKMLNLLKETKTAAVVMHSLTIPPDQINILDIQVNPNQQLLAWWKKKLDIFEKNGIDSQRIIFDPGIGFGKTFNQNSYILNHLSELNEIQQPIYLGFSRKSYLSQFTSQSADQRDLVTALQMSKINLVYCQFLRAHDIESQKIALRMN